MRTFFRSILLMMLGGMALSGCVKTDGELAGESSIYYHAAGNSVTIDGDQTEAAFHIEADCQWSISTGADWLSVTPGRDHGSKDIRVIASGPNPSTTASRQSYFVITTEDGMKKQVAVTQTPSTPHEIVPTMSVDRQTMAFAAANADTLFANISSNVGWRIDETPDWVYISATEGTGDAQLKVVCKDNYETNARTYRITIRTESGLTAGIDITQQGAARPTMGTLTIGSVKETEAQLNATVQTSGTYSLTERGFYYGTDPNPAKNGTQVKADLQGADFSTTLTGLQKKQQYYVCAYAVSPVDTVYSEVKTFTTLRIPQEGDDQKPGY